ncbi:F-box domain containing protein [Trema orientale]|uniref:F-box domain containing protein n=1 Tax=Trema orientale TaxID=63057 RepID=A0A2P5FD59_TREOI|nr:F-box domain containing protein [Trema orientale]
MMKSFLEWKPIRQLRVWVSFLSLMDSGVTCELTSDIIEEILLRLDAKSVMRCKCVCKSWLSLISHPSFKHRHLERQVPCVVLHLGSPLNNFQRLFSFRSSENFDQIWSELCPVEILNWTMGFVGSQNGVICLFNRSRDGGVYLWNPAIKKLKKLASSPPPPTHFYVHGFVYEPLANDFKVVAIPESGQQDCVNFFKRGSQVGVYSLGSDSWKNVEMPDIFSDPAVITVPHRMYSVVVNGCIHWIVNYGREAQEQLQGYSVGIVAFDPRTEVFKLIKLPPSLEPFDVGSMCNWSGCLSLVTSYSPGLIEIWVMKKYGVSDSWTKHFSFDLVKHLPSVQGNCFSPVALSDNGNLLLQLISVQHTGNGFTGLDIFRTLASYDPKSNKVQYLSPQSKTDISAFTTYVESIFLS